MEVSVLLAKPAPIHATIATILQTVNIATADISYI